MTNELGEISACSTIVFERRSKHSAERLWRAITDPDEVGKWMGYPAKIDLRIGGDWYVDFSETNDGDLGGVIVRIDPGRHVAFYWRLTVVEWKVEPADDGCTYELVQNGLVPGEGELVEGYAAGWHGFLEQLDMHLEGRHVTYEESKAIVERLLPRYS